MYSQLVLLEMVESYMDPIRTQLPFGNHVMWIFAMADTSLMSTAMCLRIFTLIPLDVGVLEATPMEKLQNAPLTPDPVLAAQVSRA
jgi:hypothetical protein